MIRRALFLAALLASAPSWSAVTLSQFPPNPGVLPGGGWKFTPGTTFADPPPARAWTNGVYGGVAAAVATDTFSLKGPAAGALSVAVATSATVPSIAAALARVAARAHGPLAIGMAAYDLLSSQGVKQGASGAEIDVGTPEVPVSVSSVSGVTGESDFAACMAYKDSLGHPGYTQVNEGGYLVFKAKEYVVTTPTENGPYGYRKYCKIEIFDYAGNLSYPNFRREIFSATTANQCPSVVDSSSGQSYTPGKYSDGNCMTGRYTAATSAAVISRLSSVVEADPPAAAQAATEAGASIDSSPYTATGPASQVGTPNTTTITGPTGTTSTTTTPTYNYTYQGDTITINTTTTTTTNVTNNEGDTTTTTKVETKPGTDEEGMCTLYPDSLACMKPGTPPDAEQIPIDRRQFTITPDTARWSPSAGACTRGAIELTSGVSINLWQPFCDFFGLIRGVVVGMFGLAGAFIFRNGIK